MEKLIGLRASFGLFLWLGCSLVLKAEDSLQIAVTASFKPTLEKISQLFNEQSGIEINLSSASSGVLHQQIVAGAPFDIFFSADTKRANSVQKRLNLPDEAVKYYAQGELVLVTNLSKPISLKTLSQFSGRIVMANPQHAPYGEAADKLLNSLKFTGERVLANNIIQAQQYLKLSLAPYALLAHSYANEFSQVSSIDQTLYEPLLHKYVLLTIKPSAQKFTEFLQTVEVQTLLLEDGYKPVSAH